MTRSAPQTLTSWLATYGAVAAVAALAVGVSRALARFQAGTLPDQYLAHAALLNAALVLGLAAVLLPAVAVGAIVLRRSGRGHPGGLALLGVLAVYLLFWLLNSSIEFRRSPDLLGGLAEDLPGYGSGLIAVGLLVAWLTLRRPLGSTLRRSAGIALALLLTTGGLRGYGVLTDPSSAAPLPITPGAERPVDVFLVLVDTLRADHLSAYGYRHATSPNLDRLAARSTVYAHAFAQAPWTRPSCGSLLTSRYPPEIGLLGLWNPLPPEVPILPQFLRIEGYATAGIVSSVHLSSQYGFDKGWDVLDIGTSYLRWTGVQQPLRRLRLIKRSEMYPRYDARELTDRAIEWIDDERAREPERPLFMYLHYSDPHTPYRPPPAEDRWREFASEAGREVQNPPSAPPEGGRTLSPAELDAMVARYDAEIAYFDAQFGRFLAALEERGVLDDALIIVTADHGEEFGEHGGWAHGHTLYNELLNVPLIVHYPAAIAGDRGSHVETTVGLVDVVPTIADVIGADWSALPLRGHSLLPAAGGTADARPIYSDNEVPPLRSLFRGNDKLIQTMAADGSVSSEEYYSLAGDFAERGDGMPAALEPGDLALMREVLTAVSEQKIEGKSIEVDDATFKELRALGYVE